MFPKHLTRFVLAPMTGLCLTMAAHANRGFTGKHAIETDLDVYVFYGDETYLFGCGVVRK